MAPLYDYIREKEPVKANWIVNDFYMSITGKRFNALFDGVMDITGLLSMLETLAPQATCTLELMQDRPSLDWLVTEHLLE